jgi:hypothetical protein
MMESPTDYLLDLEQRYLKCKDVVDGWSPSTKYCAVKAAMNAVVQHLNGNRLDAADCLLTGLERAIEKISAQRTLQRAAQQWQSVN